ncbi:hypothetical protein FOCC_FOCC005560 [Frankliniella occidentalis]|nr:hypothetical protein FOCC_FOCC005560 [Frankliniella occidentalis]
MQAQQSMQPQQTMQIVPQPQQGQRRTWGQTTTQPHPQDLRTWGDVSGKPQTGFLLHQTSTGSEVRYLNGDHQSHHPTPSVGLSSLNVYGSQHNQQPQTITHTSASGFELHGDVAPTPPPRRTPSSVNASPQHRITPTIHRTPEVKPRQHSLASDDRNAQRNSAVHTALPTPPVDDMEPQSISFIADMPSSDDISSGISKIHITSGSRTYRIPSPTRPNSARHPLPQHNDTKKAFYMFGNQTGDARPDELEIDNRVEMEEQAAPEKGFYISFDEDTTPKRPKPPLRAKRASPKKERAVTQVLDSSALFGERVGRDPTESQARLFDHKDTSSPARNANRNERDEYYHESHGKNPVEEITAHSHIASRLSNEPTRDRHSRRSGSEDSEGAGAGVGLVIGNELSNPDPNAVDEMERKKERIMLLSLQRRQQQEEMKARKEMESQQRRESEKMKEEEKARKKEEERIRRQSILEQHKLKKALEEAEREGKTVDKDLLNSVRSIPKMRNKTVTRPRPKTIHVDSGNVDLAEGLLSPSRGKKGSTSNLADSSLTPSMRRDYYRGSTDSLADRQRSEERQSRMRPGRSYSLVRDSPDDGRGTSPNRSTALGRRGSYKTSRDVPEPQPRGRPKYSTYQSNMRARKSNSLMNLSGKSIPANHYLDWHAAMLIYLGWNLVFCSPFHLSFKLCIHLFVSSKIANEPIFEHLGPGSLPPGLTSKRRMFDDGSSDISSATSSMLDYNGPRLYKQPATKSNRGILLNAVEYCVFPGVVNKEAKRRVLEEIGRSEAKHFLILFRDAGLQFRALYSYCPEGEEILKLYGTGPKQVTDRMFDRFFKYNSGGKCFSQVHTKHLTVTIDAFTIHNSLWQGKKVNLPSKKDMALLAVPKTWLFLKDRFSDLTVICVHAGSKSTIHTGTSSLKRSQNKGSGDALDDRSDEAFVVHRGRGIPTLSSVAGDEPTAPVRARHRDRSSESEVDIGVGASLPAGRPSNWEDQRRSSYAGRRSRRNSVAEDSQLTLENFGGSHENLHLLGRNPDKEPAVHVGRSLSSNGTLNGPSRSGSEKSDPEKPYKQGDHVDGDMTELRLQSTNFAELSRHNNKSKAEESTLGIHIGYTTEESSGRSNGHSAPPEKKTTTFAALPQTNITTTWKKQSSNHTSSEPSPNSDHIAEDISSGGSGGSPAMASQLLNVRLKLEEKRRQIESDKRKMELELSKQRQRVGKAAFLQAVTKDNDDVLSQGADIDNMDVEHYQESIAQMNTSLHEIQADLQRLATQQNQIQQQTPQPANITQHGKAEFLSDFLLLQSVVYYHQHQMQPQQHQMQPQQHQMQAQQHQMQAQQHQMQAQQHQMQAQQSMQPQQTMQIVPQPQQGQRRTWGQTTTQPHPQDLRTWGDVSGKPQTGFLLHQTSTGSEVRYLNGDHQSHHPTPSVGLSSLNVYGSQHNQQPQTITHTSASGFELHGDVAPTPPPRRTPSSVNASPQHRITPTIHRTPEVKPRQHSLASDDRNAQRNSAVHTALPTPPVDDMEPQSISFIADMPSSDDISSGISKIHITSGSRTYRIPSPTRPNSARHPLPQHNDTKKAFYMFGNQTGDARPDELEIDNRVEMEEQAAPEKGFYISFDEDTTPKRPKPPLRAKRASPKKERAVTQVLDSSALFGERVGRDPTESQARLFDHKDTSSPARNANRNERDEYYHESHGKNPVEEITAHSHIASRLSNEPTRDRHSRRSGSEDSEGAGAGVGLVIGNELSNPDPNAVDEMERKKERIMLLSLQRRQQQEEMKARKEMESQQRRESEKMKEEEKARKKEEERIRRQSILEQHKLKKALEEAEREGKTVDKDLLNSVRSIPKMRNKTVTRPRPKTIHVDSGNVDLAEGLLSPSRGKKGSTSNLADSSLTPSMRRDYYRGSTDSLADRQRSEERQSRMRPGRSYSLVRDSPDDGRGTSPNRSTALGRRGSYKTSRDVPEPQPRGRPKYSTYQSNMRARKSNSLMNLSGKSIPANHYLDWHAAMLIYLGWNLVFCSPFHLSFKLCIHLFVSSKIANEPIFEHLGPGSLPPGLTSKRRMFDDGSSDISSATSSMLDYNGPRLYKQPATKSNRGILLNAVEYCVFPGVVNKEAKRRVLEEIGRSEAKHFLILFRDAGLQFRALYSYCPEGEEILKLYGTGPKQVTDRMFDRFFKYNSGGKCFSQVHTKHLTVTIDAFTIHNSLWQGKKVNLPSKKDMALVI